MPDNLRSIIFSHARPCSTYWYKYRYVVPPLLPNSLSSPPEDCSIDGKVLIQYADFSLCWYGYGILGQELVEILNSVIEQLRSVLPKLFSHIIKQFFDVALNEYLLPLGEEIGQRYHQLRRYHASLGVSGLEMWVGKLYRHKVNAATSILLIQSEQPTQIDVGVAPDKVQGARQIVPRHSTLRMTGHVGPNLQPQIVHLRTGLFLSSRGGQLKEEAALSASNVQVERERWVVERPPRPSLG